MCELCDSEYEPEPEEAEAGSASTNLLCAYSCPCGANEKDGSNYAEGICSRVADMEIALDALKLIYVMRYERPGWKEIGKSVSSALLKIMGNDNYNKWVTSLD